VTGDLGLIGSKLLLRVLNKSGIELKGNYSDCGVMIYNPEQDTHAGGSGCGCSAVVLSGHILQKMMKGDFKKVLFIGSGCLHSPVTSLQGETMPGIGHAVSIETV